MSGRDIRDVHTRKLLYTALVRPLMEYSSSVWSPYLVKHRRLIENIQRSVTKFILNYPPREVNYINTLDLLPLDFRRQIYDLVLLFKYKTGIVPAILDLVAVMQVGGVHEKIRSDDGTEN